MERIHFIILWIIVEIIIELIRKNELFENCVLKGKRLQRVDIQEEYSKEIRKNDASRKKIYSI